MPSEKFEIQNEKELVLRGVIESDNPRKKQPAVIFLNGFLDTMDTPWKQQLAADLRKEGYVTVGFDYAWGFGTGAGQASKFTLTNQVKDAERVIDHVTRRAYVKEGKIVVVGHCFGGMGCILLGAFDERVAAVVSMSSPYDFSDTRATRFDERDMTRIRLKRYFHLCGDDDEEVRIDYSFFEDGLKKDMARATRNLTQPILITHGRKDPSIPVSNAQEIYNRVAGKKQLEILSGMEHHPTDSDMKVLLPMIKDFLKKNL